MVISLLRKRTRTSTRTRIVMDYVMNLKDVRSRAAVSAILSHG